MKTKISKTWVKIMMVAVFLIKVPKNVKNDVLGIAYLGYKNELIPLKNLESLNNVIILEPSPIPIEEVIIRQSDPLELIMAAKRNIKNNYPNTPEQQVGFYRETIKQNRNYVEGAEGGLGG